MGAFTCEVFQDVTGRYVLGLLGQDGREEWFCRTGGRDYGRNRAIPWFHYSYGRRRDAVRAAKRLGYSKIIVWEGTDIVRVYQ